MDTGQEAKAKLEEKMDDEILEEENSEDDLPTEEETRLSILQKEVFSNEVILMHLFSTVPLEDLKSYRLVCSNWKDVSDSEFKKRSIFKFDFQRHRTNRPYFHSEVEERHIFTHRAKNCVATFKEFEFKDDDEMVKPYSVIPRDSFFFKGKIFWEDEYLQQFLQHDGKLIKHFRGKLHSSVADLLKFRNIVLEFMPNLETLSIVVTPDLMRNSTDQILPENKLGRLNSLRSIHLRRPEPNLHPQFNIFDTATVELFQDLISAANGINEMNLSNNFLRDVPNFNTPWISTLKTLSITKSQQSYDEFEDLIKMSYQGLRLNSFSVQYYNDGQMMFLDLDPLMKFLHTQRRSLRKLRINWKPVQNPITAPPTEFFLGEPKDLNFPRMTFLEQFDISYNAFFNNSMYVNFGIVFEEMPNLKTLKIRYGFRQGIELQPFEPLNTFVLESGENIIESVTSVLIEYSRTWMWWLDYVVVGPLSTLEDHFRCASVLFPNLRNIKIVEWNSRSYEYIKHSYDGQRMDSYSYAVPEGHN